MKIENDLVHQASTKQLSLDEYKQLSVILSTRPTNCLVDALSPFDMINILSFLNFNDEDIHEVSKDIARYILTLFQLDSSSTSELLISVVNVENDVLSTMIFDELTNRILKCNAQSDPIHLTQPFIQLVLELLFESNLQLAMSAQRLLINYCKQSRDTCKQAFLPTIQSKFVDISLNNSLHLFRYIDMALSVAVSTLDRDIFTMVLSDDAVVTRLSELLSGDDVLVHLNALQAVKQLLGNQLGYELLTRTGFLAQLCTRLPHIAEEPWNDITLPSYLAVFAELCCQQHCLDALHSYPNFLGVMETNLDRCSHDNGALRMQLLETVASIVSVTDCKLFMATDYESFITKSLLVLVQLMDRSTTAYQTRAGTALASIFSAPLGHAEFATVTRINEHWFNLANANNRLSSCMFSLMKLPIEQLKLCALHLGAQIATQMWGVVVIVGHSQMVDHLMQRSDEWKSCIDMKFDLITNVVASMDACNDPLQLNADGTRKMRQYLLEGKYFTLSRREEVFLDEDV